MGGIGEALAVMLSVVVFGLGVMTLVARHEVALTRPGSGLAASIGGAPHEAHPNAAALPGESLAR